MSRIPGKGNLSTELTLARLFRAEAVHGWRRHTKLPGKPDFVFPKQKLAIFVDGDFWHGNKTKRLPSSNVDFWKEKIVNNQARDRRVDKELRRRGWRVIRIWESALKRNPIACLKRIQRGLQETRSTTK